VRRPACVFSLFFYLSFSSFFTCSSFTVFVTASRIPIYAKSNLNINGYRISVEEKGYFKEKKRRKKYLSVETLYLNGRYTDYLTREDIANHSYVMDTISVRRETASLNFKYRVSVIFKPLIFDFSLRVGFKYRRVKYYNVDPSALPVRKPEYAAFTFRHRQRQEGT
jgi:hypothetical protein